MNQSSSEEGIGRADVQADQEVGSDSVSLLKVDFRNVVRLFPDMETADEGIPSTVAIRMTKAVNLNRNTGRKISGC